MPSREYYDPDTNQIWQTDDQGNFSYVREATPQESPQTPPVQPQEPSFFDQVMEAVGSIGQPQPSYRAPTPYGTAPVVETPPSQIEARGGPGTQGYVQPGFMGLGRGQLVLPPEPPNILTQHEVGHYIGPQQRQQYAQQQGIPQYGELPAAAQGYVQHSYGANTLKQLSPKTQQEELQAEWFALMKSPLSEWKRYGAPTGGGE